MMEYIREVKRQLRDQYKFKPTGGTKEDQTFDHIPDGVYPMLVRGRMDKVRIEGDRIICGDRD